MDAVANFNFEKGKGHTSGEKGKASEIIAKQIGVSTKTVEKTRVVLKEATPEQLEAIKKDELSMNQVFNQIREKRKEENSEKESEVSASTETETKADAKTEVKTEKPKAKPKSEKQSAKTTSKSKTDEAFEKGVRYAISEIRKGISLEELEKSLSA